MMFSVYAELAPEVSKKLDRLARKAAGYGIPFTYSAAREERPQVVRILRAGPSTSTMVEVGRRTVAAVDFEVECDELIRANGWTLRAKVEHGDKGNIVTPFGGFEPKPEWYTAAPNCDHCHSNRPRSVTFFVEHTDGALRQVGSTCLKDYTGISPATAAMWAEVQDIVETDISCCTEERWAREDMQTMYDVLSVLGHAYDVIRKFGYRKSDEPDSTRGTVQNRLAAGAQPTAEGLEQAETIRDWLIERGRKVAVEDAELDELWDQYCPDGDDGDERYWSRARAIHNAWDAVSDLERKCIPLAQSGFAKMKHVGLLAYMPMCYERYMERLAREEQRKVQGAKSEYVGEVGKRITLTVAQSALLSTWDGYYGTTWLYKFVDESGNVFIWRSSRRFTAEDGATIRATGKEHSERDGVKQTVVTRCSLAA